MQPLDTTKLSAAAFCDWFYGSFITGDDHILFARRAARATARAIQVRHDQHVAATKSSAGRAATRTAHLVKIAAKLRRNADPQARAQAIDDINAPIVERRRMASLQALVLDIAHKKGLPPAACYGEAVQALAQLEGAVAYRAAVKRHRAARKYPADGTDVHTATRYKAAAAVQVAA
jgi:hypothetical protein